ncbi:hypothetical protein EYF80_000371 [Liparis tanakae]|uniref:Uncharacterized protein n=1 Tax=Liparis tanakae TaxID=230148 RepID=A0A4Z2JGU3_9TELE|nr:hypothetical protein EYF80_000371 [Liparis tanakae]
MKTSTACQETAQRSPKTEPDSLFVSVPFQLIRSRCGSSGRQTERGERQIDLSNTKTQRKIYGTLHSETVRVELKPLERKGKLDDPDAQSTLLCPLKLSWGSKKTYEDVKAPETNYLTMATHPSQPSTT